jgi:hypothetical protein
VLIWVQVKPGQVNDSGAFSDIGVEASLDLTQRFGRFGGRSARGADGIIRSLMTHSDRMRPSIAALHGLTDMVRPLLTEINPGPNLKEPPMRDVLRPLSGTLIMACLATGLTILSTGGALAQAKQAPSSQMAPAQPAPPPLKQMALTDKQIEGVLAAQKDMDAITQKLPPNAAPSPKVVAQLDAVAKKNGFASYDAYNDVVENITLVLSGFDPVSKKYVGFDAAMKAQIAQVQADKTMSAKDKKDALAELNQALKSPSPPVENKGNIDLVGKYYDKLADALGGGQQ